MTDAPSPKLESLVTAFSEQLDRAGDRWPNLSVLDVSGDPVSPCRGFGARFPDRCQTESDPPSAAIDRAAELSAPDRPVVVVGRTPALVGGGFAQIRGAVAARRSNVTLIGLHGDPSDASGPPAVEDIGLMRGLPGMSVVVPADAPTTRSAFDQLVESDGPAYLRLAFGELPVVSDGAFALGRATELRPGEDLTVIAVGRTVARALEVSTELKRVGIGARVLDLASVKPFDAKAVLRAARETGAILTMEDHSVLGGIGEMIAGVTAENAPVPVRRLGVPDLFLPEGSTLSEWERSGLSMSRAIDEAWELLALRGKVQ